MKLKELCTWWSIERTLRVDAIGRRYKETEQAYIPVRNHSHPDRYADNAGGLWKALGLRETSKGTWEGNGVTVTRHFDIAGNWADLEIDSQ
jgi:hypothetical protein